MNSQTWICDSCGEELKINTNEALIALFLKEWYTLVDKYGKQYHYCSVNCLKQAVLKLKPSREDGGK